MNVPIPQASITIRPGRLRPHVPGQCYAFTCALCQAQWSVWWRQSTMADLQRSIAAHAATHRPPSQERTS